MSAATATAVTKVFRGDVRALDGLDFQSQCGEVTAIVGANGSGKSTLLRILFGMLRADSGSVRVLEFDPIQESRTVRAQTGYVSQRTTLDPEMTGREILALFCTLYGLAADQRRRCIERLVDSFALQDVIGRRVGAYSGGMRRRLHLAVGMVHEPRLLLLDEPSSDLDPDSRVRLWQILRSYADAGHALIVVTHDLEEVKRHCDRVCLLSLGQTKFDGTPQQIVAEHGRVTLQIDLDAAPTDWARLRDGLASVTGVEQARLLNRQIMLLVAEGTDAEPTVLDCLRRQSIGVAGYRQQRPNLASAYFHLTGHSLGRPSEGKDAKKQTSPSGAERKAGRQ